MAYDSTVPLNDILRKKWEEMYPDKPMPEVGTAEFNIFCDTLLSELTSDKTNVNSNPESNDQHVYEDETHVYTKLDWKYISDKANAWIDNNPGKVLGFIGLITVGVSLKLWQLLIAGAVHKGNLKTIKYMMKHNK